MDSTIERHSKDQCGWLVCEGRERTGIIAVVYRDESGNIVAGFTKEVWANSAEQVEALACMEALRFFCLTFELKYSLELD
ncbi:hypothetical protein ACJRO7_011076, partial [Eucalyptus globulus]